MYNIFIRYCKALFYDVMVGNLVFSNGISVNHWHFGNSMYRFSSILEKFDIYTLRHVYKRQSIIIRNISL